MLGAKFLLLSLLTFVSGQSYLSYDGESNGRGQINQGPLQYRLSYAEQSPVYNPQPVYQASEQTVPEKKRPPLIREPTLGSQTALPLRSNYLPQASSYDASNPMQLNPESVVAEISEQLHKNNMSLPIVLTLSEATDKNDLPEKSSYLPQTTTTARPQQLAAQRINYQSYDPIPEPSSEKPSPIEISSASQPLQYRLSYAEQSPVYNPQPIYQGLYQTVPEKLPQPSSNDVSNPMALNPESVVAEFSEQLHKNNMSLPIVVSLSELGNKTDSPEQPSYLPQITTTARPQQILSLQPIRSAPAVQPQVQIAPNYQPTYPSRATVYPTPTTPKPEPYPSYGGSNVRGQINRGTPPPVPSLSYQLGYAEPSPVYNSAPAVQPQVQIAPNYQPTYPSRVALYPTPTTPKPEPVQSAVVVFPQQPAWTAPAPSQQPRQSGAALITETLPIIPIDDFRCEARNAYYGIENECDTFIECQQSRAWRHICPDGLHFHPQTVYPAYPCVYPSEYKCDVRQAKQLAKPTYECPNRFGFFSLADGDCSKYLMCHEGKAEVKNCPSGLVFNANLSTCDWPENVPQCSPSVFKGFTCPYPPVNDPDFLTRHRYGNECEMYVACQRGHPRLLRCDSGLSFSEVSQVCIDSDLVEGCALSY